MKIEIHAKIVLFISIWFLLTGCVERYVSRGTIASNTDWEAYSGGGRDGSSKDATILVNLKN